MVASDEYSQHQCAIIIPAGNDEVCKVITCAYTICGLYYMYKICTTYTHVQAIDCIGHTWQIPSIQGKKS